VKAWTFLNISIKIMTHQEEVVSLSYLSSMYILCYLDCMLYLLSLVRLVDRFKPKLHSSFAVGIETLRSYT
jgi:hypothetical protein